jgi:hypothetical protein
MLQNSSYAKSCSQVTRYLNSVIRSSSRARSQAAPEFTEVTNDSEIKSLVEQAWGAAAKHSTRRTTSVKKCVNSI